MRRLCSVAMVLAFSPFFAPSAGAEGRVVFRIADGVSAENEAYVREGIALAQRYVADHLSDASYSVTTVEVGELEDARCGEKAAACASLAKIQILTDSEGWKASAPFERVRIVVHEYIHVYQHVLLGELADFPGWYVNDGAIPPAWFVEGMAEYLSFDAVIREGIVDEHDVRDFANFAIDLYPDMPSLEELEERSEFRGETGPVYSLSYLALELLMKGQAPSDLDLFFELIQESRHWEGPFLAAFGQGINSFYTAFEESRDVVGLPISFAPRPFILIEPQALESSIRMEPFSLAYEVGEQITVVGWSDPSAVCNMSLKSDGAGEEVTRATHADGSGRVFWLITIPDTFDDGPATITASCGGDPAGFEIELTDAA